MRDLGSYARAAVADMLDINTEAYEEAIKERNFEVAERIINMTQVIVLSVIPFQSIICWYEGEGDSVVDINSDEA
jgi:hypothetical protein